MAELQTEIRRAAGERLHRRRNRLEIRTLAGRSEQLDARLQHFVAASRQVRIVAVDPLRIIKAQRLFLVLQPCRRQTGDRHGGIGTHHNQPSAAIRHLIHNLRSDTGRLGIKNVHELHPGRNHLIETARGKDPAQLFLHHTVNQTLLKKEILRPLGCDLAVSLHLQHTLRSPLFDAGNGLSL